jgi:hypothetical protein
MQILTGPERRRCWSAGEKCKVVAEAGVDGACLAEVAGDTTLLDSKFINGEVIFEAKGLLPSAPAMFVLVEVRAEEQLCGSNARPDDRIPRAQANYLSPIRSSRKRQSPGKF